MLTLLTTSLESKSLLLPWLVDIQQVTTNPGIIFVAYSKILYIILLPRPLTYIYVLVSQFKMHPKLDSTVLSALRRFFSVSCQPSWLVGTGGRAFSVAALCLWNSLPRDARRTPSLLFLPGEDGVVELGF